MNDPARSWPVEAETPMFFAVIQSKENPVPLPTPDEDADVPRGREISVWDNRHQSVAHFKPLFAFEHLPEHLQEISRPCAELAAAMLMTLPDGPELTVGLRKLLEAKDAFVRQAVITRSES